MIEDDPPFAESSPDPPVGAGSVTRRLPEAQAGDPEAFRFLFARYFEGLVRLARARLLATSQSRATTDEEDVALSAFQAFFANLEEGRYPDLHGREDLWKVLVKITLDKAVDKARHDGRLKRGGGLVRAAAEGDDGGLDYLIGREPSPEIAVLFADEVRHRIAMLEERSRRVVELRLAGRKTAEIAGELGVSRRTVELHLERVRKLWSSEH